MIIDIGWNLSDALSNCRRFARKHIRAWRTALLLQQDCTHAVLNRVRSYSQGGSSTGSSRSSGSRRTSLFHGGPGSVMSGLGSAATAITTTAAAAAVGAPPFHDARTTWPSHSVAAADTNAIMADTPADLHMDALDEYSSVLEFLHGSPALDSAFGLGGAGATAANDSGLLPPGLPPFAWSPSPEPAQQGAPSRATPLQTCLGHNGERPLPFLAS